MLGLVACTDTGDEIQPKGTTYDLAEGYSATFVTPEGWQVDQPSDNAIVVVPDSVQDPQTFSDGMFAYHSGRYNTNTRLTGISLGAMDCIALEDRTRSLSSPTSIGDWNVYTRISDGGKGGYPYTARLTFAAPNSAECTDKAVIATSMDGAPGENAPSEAAKVLRTELLPHMTTTHRS